MNLVIRMFVTAVLVMLLANWLPGVEVHNFFHAFMVAVVLALLNIFVKPILILFTLPVTFFTFGLFLLVINALMIQFSGYIVGGFKVDSFWHAFLFSIVLTISQSVVYNITDSSSKEPSQF